MLEGRLPFYTAYWVPLFIQMSEEKVPVQLQREDQIYPSLIQLEDQYQFLNIINHKSKERYLTAFKDSRIRRKNSSNNSVCY